MDLEEEKTILYEPAKTKRRSGSAESKVKPKEASKTASKAEEPEPTPPLTAPVAAADNVMEPTAVETAAKSLSEQATGSTPRVPEFKRTESSASRLSANAGAVETKPRVPEFRPASQPAQQHPMKSAGNGPVPKVPEFRPSNQPAQQQPMKTVETGPVPKVPEFKPENFQAVPPRQAAVNAFGTGGFRPVQPTAPERIPQQPSWNSGSPGVPEFRPAQPPQPTVNAWQTGGFQPIQQNQKFEQPAWNGSSPGVPEFRPAQPSQPMVNAWQTGGFQPIQQEQIPQQPAWNGNVFQQPGSNQGVPPFQQRAYLQGDSGFNQAPIAGYTPMQAGGIAIRPAGSSSLKRILDSIVLHKRICLIILIAVLAIVGLVVILNGNNAKNQVFDLVNRFNEAYNNLDVYALADCINPKETEMVEKIKSYQRYIVNGWDLRSYMGITMTFAPYDCKLSGNRGTVYVYCKETLDEQNITYENGVQVHREGAEGVQNDIANVVKVNGKWYFSAKQPEESVVFSRMFSEFK